MQMTGHEVVHLMRAYGLPEEEVNRIVHEYCTRQIDEMTMHTDVLEDTVIYGILANIRNTRERLGQIAADNNSKNHDGIAEMLMYLEYEPAFNVKLTMDDFMRICRWLEELRAYRNMEVRKS